MFRCEDDKQKFEGATEEST